MGLKTETFGGDLIFRIAICDDNRPAAEQIERYLNQELTPLEYTADIYANGESLLSAMKNTYYDLLFLDIKMEVLDGVVVGKKLRESKNCPLIIYISSFDDQYQEVSEVQPYRFLKKPIKIEKFKEYLRDALKLLKNTDYFFQYKKNGVNIYVRLSSILYFESKAHLVRIVMENKRSDEFYGKISEILDQIQDKNFLQIHQSVLVNTAHICQCTYTRVLLSNGEQKNISAPKRKEIRTQWAKIWEDR